MRKLIYIFLIVLAFSTFSCKKEKTIPKYDETISVLIGDQIWMKSNLEVDHYRNGDIIPFVPDIDQWEKLKTGAWCYLNNDSSHGRKYGKLYNWFAVNDPRGLAPEGWHIPSDKEWNAMIKYLGGKDIAGGKLKSIGTNDWKNPNEGATNLSGFGAIPGGRRYFLSSRPQYGDYCYFWTTTEVDITNAWCKMLNYANDNIETEVGYKVDGMSVRCIKN